MPSISIVDDLLYPRDKIEIKFSGENVASICNLIRPILESVLQVEAKDTYERLLKWDSTSNPRSFYNEWTTNKEEDKWTVYSFKIIIKGSQDINTRKGNVTIEIYSWLKTSYEYSNFIQRFLWILYNRVFYYKRRREYMERGKWLTFQLRDEIMKALNIPKITEE
jgi:hypothetical protein